MTLLWILGGLFLALMIAVPLLERFGKPHAEEEVSSLSRWILPLCMLLAVVQLIMYMMRG
ncbi:hypothetical protein HBA55_24985 [Pseudomaricurvus alkylphenolicus]|jgi:hypothetical protein|uniref:hypothetical protein n=1 Tax=Pseudomaricurvus alkylphenolicus TaxID=1306991 RepID=UPI0014231A52|nr:hypothetical protein [Pseudomaricurvus alkylphenolicus]NIB42886.1 hypothetical protein [Pseudomaricurvus alkylphenolicus]